MARVPDYSAPEVSPQFIPQASINVNTSPEMFGGRIAQAESQAGGAISEVGKETSATVVALKGLEQETVSRQALNDWQNTQIDAWTQYSQLKGKDALDARPAFEEQMNNSMQDISNNLSPIARRDFLNGANFQAFRLKFAAAQHAAQQNVKYMTDTAQSSVDIAQRNLATTAFANDPTAVSANITSIKTHVADMGEMNGWSFEEVKAHTDAALDKAQAGRAQVLFQQNPQGTLTALRNDPAQFEGLSDVTRAKLISSMTKGLKAAALANPGSMGAVIGGDKNEGTLGEDAAPAASGESAATTTNDGSPAQQVFGPAGSDESAGKFYEHLRAPVQMAADAGAPPLTTYGIAQDTTSLTNFDQDRKLVAGAPPGAQIPLQQSIAAKWQTLSADPAGYLSRQSPDTYSAVLDGLNKNPAGLPAAIAAQDRMYDALHVAPEDRSVLSVSTSQKMVSQLNAAPIPQSLDGLQKMEANTGANWGRVYGDLVRRGNLPVQFQAIMSLQSPMLRDTLARSYTTGEVGKENIKKDFEKIIPDYPTATKEINRELSTSEWRNFTGSMAATGVPDSVIAGYQDGARRLAYQMIVDGKDASAAASDARKAFTDQYRFIDKARVPSDMYHNIDNRATDALVNLKAEDLSIPAANPTDDLSKQYLIGVRAAGRWITNQDSSGMVRQDSDGRIVRLKNGSPLTVPFTWPAQGAATPHPTTSSLTGGPVL